MKNILPNHILTSRSNQTWTESGMDCITECLDKDHFLQYPDPVIYQYNSRGFRDAEWPDDLKNPVWCIGESFTVGLGTPYEYIWPQILQRKINQRTINLAMDGGSNNWIARRATEILTEIRPTRMIIMWTYVERREANFEDTLQQQWQTFYSAVKDPSWPTIKQRADFKKLPHHIRHELATQHSTGHYLTISNDLESIVPRYNIDELLRTQRPDATQEEHEENFKICLQTVLDANASTQLIHVFVPDFAIKQEQYRYLDMLKGQIFVPPFKILDWARDHHHFDRKTSEWLVKQLILLLG